MRRFLLLAAMLILSGCTAPPAGTIPPPEPPAPQVTPSPSSSPHPASPASSPFPLFTPSPSPPPRPSILPSLIPAPCSPLGGYTLAELPGITSQPFIAPSPGKDDGHHGVDFAHYAYGDKTTIAGAPVQAIFGGVVAAAIADSWPYGNFVLIESTPDSSQFPQLPITASQSLYHLYAHLEQPPNFQIGEAVTCGQNLGTVGNTGWSGNYHLHIETRLGPPGVTFEGMAYYQTTATAEERANYARWRFGGEFAPFDPFIVLIP